MVFSREPSSDATSSDPFRQLLGLPDIVRSELGKLLTKPMQAAFEAGNYQEFQKLLSALSSDERHQLLEKAPPQAKLSLATLLYAPDAETQA